jgi:hypothetical protein
MQDPYYCLDNGGTNDDGAALMIWTCSGNNNQRFKYDPSAGTISVRSYPVEVVQAIGSSFGTGLQTLTASGASNQSWTLAQ